MLMLICVLGFPVNLSGDWLLTNIKHWKPSAVQLVGEGKSVSWGGAKTKGEVKECEITKNMFFHSDLLQLCLKKKRKIAEFFPDTTVLWLKTRVAN